MGVTSLKIRIALAADSNYFQYSYCANLIERELECLESENCCDKLNIKLKAYSNTNSDCAFDLVISNKGALSKCKVFGVRVRYGAGGDTVYTLSPQTTPLNLDIPKQIWYKDLGSCGIVLETGLPYPAAEEFTIEILDSLGAVKCTVKDTIFCCPVQSVASKSALDEEVKPIPMTVGGIITETTASSSSLRFVIKNMGDALHANIRLTDIKGSILLKQSNTLPKDISAGELDISKLPSGTYFLSVQTDLWQRTQQVVIIK